ncbi:MAG: hypothetical protein LUF92_09555, partial [Clostridiales bacterium]|nr:hypothetical protein [Clostridiales bacterium]
VRYSRDKPKDCKFCYYWQGREKGCLMGEDNCAYLIREEEPAERSRCDGCPYGRYSPCIGWCTVDVINAVFKNRLAAVIVQTDTKWADAIFQSLSHIRALQSVPPNAQCR